MSMGIIENGAYKQVAGNVPLQTTYSTEETKTGATWIDGKPIYRKVFVAPNTLGDASGVINIPWPNIDSPVSFFGYGETKSTSAYAPCKRILPFGYYGGSTGNDLWAINASVMGDGGSVTPGMILQVGSEASGTIDKFVLVLEYTKTTDA